jgi:hypothetical protein
MTAEELVKAARLVAKSIPTEEITEARQMIERLRAFPWPAFGPPVAALTRTARAAADFENRVLTLSSAGDLDPQVVRERMRAYCARHPASWRDLDLTVVLDDEGAIGG